MNDRPINNSILVDFIIPQFEDHRIIQSIRSITLHAEGPRFRIIVQDGGSNLILQKKIKNELRAHDIHVIEADGGIFDAINKAKKTASAPWIGWLGADDLLAPSFRVQRLENAKPSVEFLSYATFFFDEKTGRISRVYRPVACRSLRIAGFHLPHFSTFLRLHVFQSQSFSISERNYADQIYFYELESKFSGLTTKDVSTFMAQGGASNDSFMGIISTNKKVYAAMSKRRARAGAATYVILKLFYKSFQRLSAILLAKKIENFL